ncbi:hypothetical protein [Roseofilum capinflatum]|uniref:Uncharacterized protein n=1 Tax=Roseofilum capinflatum BLCC-M114 TaxID=3022440 RepID=A0ABT7B8L5_9CYAN|nr:hypothetical protein [Roseofilum capinflatum]MDJ1174846.1 hypothetical protein [Roseofilum capinflatum BLCC-M114]
MWGLGNMWAYSQSLGIGFPYSPFPIPHSLFPIPHSPFPIPYSLFPIT